MDRRNFIKSVGAGAASLVFDNLITTTVSAKSKYSVKKPNLVFVFSDQQRRQALGFMGQDPVLTPNIDSFADESLVLTNAISGCPLCAPFRAMLLTGKYPTNNGVTTNGLGLDKNDITMGELLKRSGYDTAYVGKWHCYEGSGIEYIPESHQHGFDYWYVCNCNHNVFSQLYYTDSPDPVFEKRGWQPEHETDVAIDYIKNKRNKEKSFAMVVSWVPPHNTHTPWREHREPGNNEPEFTSDYHKGLNYLAPKEYESEYINKYLPRRKNVKDNYAAHDLPGYFGGCTGLDYNFGRILDCLKEEGLEDDTIVVYSSDHGDMMGSHGLMGKTWFFEESIGIPFIIRWPGKIKPGKEDVLLNGVDIMPTLLSLMNVDVPSNIDGKNLSSVLLGRTNKKPDSVLLGYYTPPNMLKKGASRTKYCWRGIRTPRYTYSVNELWYKKLYGDRVLFDNLKDPYQMNPINRGQGKDKLMDNLESKLESYLLTANDPWAKKMKS